MAIRGKKIVLGVCGSVAAVRVPDIVRGLVKQGIEVECVMTDAAREIIHPNVLEWASGRPVVTKLTGAVEHVKSCGVNGEASLLLICPATSNTISKIACGIDDTTVSTYATTALGSGMRILIAPAMHISLYKNPFVLENIEKLKKHGVVFIQPRFEEDKAKIAENKTIIERVSEVLAEI